MDRNIITKSDVEASRAVVDAELQSQRNTFEINRFVRMVEDTHVQGYVSGYYCNTIDQQMVHITPAEWYGRLATRVEAANATTRRERAYAAQSLCAQVMRELIAEKRTR